MPPSLFLRLLGVGEVGRKLLAVNTCDSLDNALAHGLIHEGTLIVLSAVNQPLHGGNDEDDAEWNDGVVHVGSVDGCLGREDEEDGGQESPGNADLLIDMLVNRD